MSGAGEPSTSFDGFDYEWLRLRFEADARCRDPGLLGRALARLAGRSELRVLDLGAGSGGNLLYLAPRLPAPVQRWALIERDRDLVERVRGFLESFADRVPGLQVTDGAMQVDGRTARYDSQVASFLDPQCGIYAQPWDAVVANAVFDLMSAAQLDGFLDLARARWQRSRPALYFTLHLDSHIAFAPAVPGDADVIALFHGHMQREQAFGRSLGPACAGALIDGLGARGLDVQAAPSNLRLGAGDAALLEANLGFMEGAARDMIAAGAGQGMTEAALEEWLADRRGRIERGALGLEIGFQDVLATWR